MKSIYTMLNRNVQGRFFILLIALLLYIGVIPFLQGW